MNRKLRLKVSAPNKSHETKLNRIHYKVIISLLFIYVLHHIFIEGQLLGHDIRYIIYIFLMPTITGMCLLGLYRRKFLLDKYLACKNTFQCIFIIAFFSLQGLIVSYFSLAAFAHYTWNYANKLLANQNVSQVIYCPIDRGFTGRNSCLYFKFQNGIEKFDISREDADNYSKIDSAALQIELTIKKGIWNYYTVEKWDIIKNLSNKKSR